MNSETEDIQFVCWIQIQNNQPFNESAMKLKPQCYQQIHKDDYWRQATKLSKKVLLEWAVSSEWWLLQLNARKQLKFM